MEKTYYPSKYKIIKNMVGFLFIGGLAYIIVMAFTNNQLYSIAAGLAVALLPQWTFYRQFRYRCTLRDDTLVITLASGETWTFNLSDCSIHAETVNNDDHHIMLEHQDGKRDYITLDWMVNSDFRDLLNEMGVTGPKAKPKHLDAQ